MRHIALLALVALTGVAHAEEDDPDFVAMPARSVELAYTGHATHVAGLAEGGGGPSLELALGKDRWQAFAEGMLAGADRDLPRAAPDSMRVEGRMVRGGLGLRWLARQFIPDSSGGLELYLSAATGVESYYWRDGGRLVRTDLTLGVGMQGRAYRFHQVTCRLDLRVLFARDTSGLVAGFGVAW